MGWFGHLLKNVGTNIIGNAASSLIGGTLNNLFAPQASSFLPQGQSPVINGYQDLLPSVTDATKGLIPAGQPGGGLGELFGGSGFTGGGSGNALNFNMPEVTLQPAVGGASGNSSSFNPLSIFDGMPQFQNPLINGFQDLLPGIPKNIQPAVNGQNITPANDPVTVGQGQPQQQQPLINGNVDLLPGIPNNIQAPGGGPGGNADRGFDLNDFLKTLTSAGLLGSQIFGDNKIGGQDVDSMRKLAGDLGNRGSHLLDTSLANQQGHLDATALNAIERRSRQAEAGVRQNYAQMGMSGSSMEAQDLAGVQERATQETFDIGQNMAISGLQTAAQLIGDQSNIYSQLMQAQIAQDEELSRAIMDFAAASAR